MKTTRMIFATLRTVALAGFAALVGAIPGLSEGGLAAGDAAPAFELPGSDGKTYGLEQFAGERAVVVAWYPKAFTGG